MERERIDAIVEEQFTAQRLMPIKIMYLMLTAGVVLLFALGTFFGIQTQGDTPSSVSVTLACISSGASVLLFLLSNKFFNLRLSAIDESEDLFGQVQVALLIKAALVEGGALAAGCVWLLTCLQTQIAHIPPVCFVVFFGLAAPLLNTANYLPTTDRVRWWLHNEGI